ncbi:hypothetical protein LQ567_04875 [Niabella pedocola]|uniref:Uncharacterized protein n=1 Tax=Niabella pedocola TaxID=1752077 RepID=A0ABS8PLV8_9BACT|nr:hypothetical protein [Niabella pedocola]MCD2422084.1 hypothetical protein [Niabella pedocola]
MSQDLIKCPKCGSSQIAAGKKGFSGKKAVVGGLLTGGIGILAGTLGSNKVKITCMACGNNWFPSQYQSQTVKYEHRRVQQEEIDKATQQAVIRSAQKAAFKDAWKRNAFDSAEKHYRAYFGVPDANLTREQMEKAYKDFQSERRVSIGLVIVVLAIIIYLIAR